jgi:CelD/BcsL family acetyltransferase involved in cellulose biosynthesis
MFCKGDEPIFDSFIPLTARGGLAAGAISALHRGKRLVKQNQTLLRLAQRLRHALH